MATVDEVLEETVNGKVTRVAGVRDLDEGVVVDLEVLEHRGDPDRRRTSRAEVVLGEDHSIRDVNRRPSGR